MNRLKRMVVMTAFGGSLLASLLAGCGGQSAAGGAAGSGKETAMNLPNPFVSVETLEEAEEKTGFDMEAPEEIAGYTQTGIQVMNDELIQIFYGDPEQEDAGRMALVRKGEGTDDVSGDYNIYEDIAYISSDDIGYELRGNNGKFYVASWIIEGYSYSLSVRDGLGEDELLEAALMVR